MTDQNIHHPRCRRGLAAAAALLGLGLAVLGTAGAGQTQAPLDKDHAAKMAQGLDLFKKQVKPLLMKRCLRCHGGDKTQGEFDMTDRAELLRGGSHGPAVLPGKSKESFLYQVITHRREPHMPKSGNPLTAEQTALIAKWIDLGAPYDDALVARKDRTPAWTRKTVTAEDRRLWSLQSLQRVAPPKVQRDGWCKTAVDHFILAKLEGAGIQPNLPAERRKLIRRAYFDLIGLPPTPEEVDLFLNDPAPDAYPKLIDRLLASPHHGERWASYWLDLARFAESHGFEHDYDRPTAYHYRDFVIKALNNDVPYNTFVRWQIAGDEIAPDNNLAVMATGFLAAGVHSTQITKNEVEKHRYDELDDKVHTLSTAFLGLTVGCARCHDHKYDPIPSADYYRMLAAFTTTVRTEVEMDFDPQGYAKAKTEFEKAHAPLVEALKKFETEQLPPRLAQWEQSQPEAEWVIIDPASAVSSGGAKLVKQADGSLLATGPNPAQETFTITAHTDQTGITAVRLEALADPSLVKGGPGRADNGNFALTDFKVTIAPKGGKTKPVQVKLQNARATFEQKGLPVRAAIDNDPKSGWAVDPQFGWSHAAVFETEVPTGFPGGSVLTFTLQFKNNVKHSIGRPRLAITTLPPTKVSLKGQGLPASISSILHRPTAKRTAEQQATLLHWFSAIDPEGKQFHQKIQEHLAQAPKRDLKKVLIASEGLPAVRLHTQGDDFFDKTYFLRRGDPNNKDGVAEPGFLQVLMTTPDREQHWHASPPKGWRTSYRRTALANWVTDVDQGAGRLLARVIVNRLWQHHLGRGIVATPSDFGTRGELPTHPELLNWLASELIDNGWKLKHLHKVIMTSAVYMQGGETDAARSKSDPDNKLFWHFPRHRLEAEVIRDSLLSVAGQLDTKMFGPGTLDEAMKRRAIYFTVKRSKLIPMLQIFDAPQALSGVAQRPTTTIAPQALYLMNNPHVRSWAHSFARRIAPDDSTPLEQTVRRGYLIALAREPSPQELADGAAFIREQLQVHTGANRRELAIADFCQVLMCLNEFIYVE
jgi:hypothetical protein